MDAQRFSAVARIFADRVSRRAALRGLRAGTGLAAVALGTIRPRAGDAQDATPVVVGGGPAGYLVVRRYRLQPGPRTTSWYAGSAPASCRSSGGRPDLSSTSSTDPGGGDHVAVSVFADQAGTGESTRRAACWSEQNVADLVELTLSEVVGGQVRLHAVATGTTIGTPAP